jgi:hypothetical protein
MMLLGELASSCGVEPGAPTRVWFQIDSAGSEEQLSPWFGG